MTLDSSKVRVGVTGGIYVAPLGTTLPTNATEALDALFLAGDLGFADESGIQENQNNQINNIRAWQNGAVVRKVETEHDATWAWVSIETNIPVLKQFYSEVTGTVDDAEIRIRGGLPERQAWVIDVIDGDVPLRIVVAEGQITTRGTKTYANTTAVGHPMTLTAYPSTELDEDKAVIYLGDSGS